MARPERFRRQWLDLGMQDSTLTDKNLVLDVLKNINTEMEQQHMNMRATKTRTPLRQKVREALPRMPAPIRNMNSDIAVDGIRHSVRSPTGPSSTPSRTAFPGPHVPGRTALAPQAFPLYPPGPRLGGPVLQSPEPRSPVLAAIDESLARSELLGEFRLSTFQQPEAGPLVGSPEFGVLVSGGDETLELFAAPNREEMFALPGSNLFGTIQPPPGFKPTAGPVEGGQIMETYAKNLETVTDPQPANPDVLKALMLQQRPEHKWGPISSFWNETFRPLTLDDAQGLIDSWAEEQEGRIQRFVTHTTRIRNHIVNNPDTYDAIMTLSFQNERYEIVAGWRSWITDANKWFVIEWHKLKWTSGEIQEDTEDGHYRRIVYAEQLQQRSRLERQEAKLIGRSDWIEHLHDNLPTRDAWALLCEWNEIGFDFSSPLTVYNISMDIVRESDSALLCTNYLGQMVSDSIDPLQLSPNDMWLNTAYLSIEKLKECLHTPGHFQPGQTLWWSSKIVEINDVLFTDGQTRLYDTSTFVIAVSNSLSGSWASFAGPRPKVGRHGPF